MEEKCFIFIRLRITYKDVVLHITPATNREPSGLKVNNEYTKLADFYARVTFIKKGIITFIPAWKVC